MWVIGSSSVSRAPALLLVAQLSGIPQLTRRRQTRGFTLLELVVALSIAGLVMALAIPATTNIYESMRYRGAVRDVISLLASARFQAINTGRAQNVEVTPRDRTLTLNDTARQLPTSVTLSVSSARELNRGEVAVIRFYPEGGASGGEVELANSRGSGVRIAVDWLLGGITQEPYAAP